MKEIPVINLMNAIHEKKQSLFTAALLRGCSFFLGKNTFKRKLHFRIYKMN